MTPTEIKALGDERTLSKRFFRGVTDRELLDWRPVTPRGWYGWEGIAGANVGRANAEMRSRARRDGFASAWDWVAAIARAGSK
jgi:hypothetical protein